MAVLNPAALPARLTDAVRALVPGRQSAVPALGVALLLGAAASPGSGQLTQDQALALAFPDASGIERSTAYLSEGQMAAAAEMAGPGVEIPSGVLSYYVARQAGRPLGVAYFDSHRVRTLPEVLMVVVDVNGEVRRVETVSFREPPEYRAPEGWLDLFQERSLDRELSLKGEIPNLSGATLTADAVTDAVRRVLALHRVIRPLQPSS